MVRSILLVTVLVSALFCSSALQAAQPENKGPSVIKMKMGSKTLDFSHHKHQKLTDNQCWECHESKSGKIKGWGEATAHKLCISCHDLNSKGPVSCKGCHKK